MRITLLAIFLSAVLLLTGCKNLIKGKTEIEDITFVKVIGIDKVPGTDQIRVTVTSKYSKQTKESEAPKHEHMISANGETIFDAVRNLSMYSNEKPFWGHNEFIIIGEEAANDGVIKYLDFFVREYQFRLNNRVFIVIGNTAENTLETTSIQEKFLSDRLDLLIKNIDNISVSYDTHLHELMQMFDRQFCSAFIPCINLINIIHKEYDDSEKNDLAMNGFAIFKDDKLIGFIKDDLAKGLNWVTGTYDSGIIVVRDETGGKVSLEILDEETKVIPQIDNQGNISVTVKIKVSSNIGEMMSNYDIFNEKSFLSMERQQSDIIKSQVEGVIKYAQENNSDFLDIWNKVYHKYPTKWKYFQEDWPEIFSRLPIKVEIDSKIVRTYLIRQPVGGLEVKQ